jgi:hypothetical protein
MLSDQILHRVHLVRDFLRPEGGLAAFMAQVTSTEGLAFWRAHRYDRIGITILSQLTPEYTARLDAYLAQVGMAPQTPALIA